MSPAERLAAMPPMIGFSRSGLLSAAGWKLASCFCRYSGTWLASFGLAGVGLLPSAPWQGAQTLLAMLWALAESALAAGSPEASGPAQIAKLKSANARFMPFSLREPSLKRLIF